MTALDKDQFETDVQNVIDTDPIEVVFDGQTVDVAKGNMLDENQVIAAGLQGKYEFSLMTIKSQWTTAPVQGKVIAVAGTNQRILRIREDAVGVAYVWDLGAEFWHA